MPMRSLRFSFAIGVVLSTKDTKGHEEMQGSDASSTVRSRPSLRALRFLLFKKMHNVLVNRVGAERLRSD